MAAICASNWAIGRPDARRVAIEWQDAAGEVLGKYRVDGGLQCSSALSFGQELHSVQNFGLRYGRSE